MSLELKKRIFTSIGLISLLILMYNYMYEKFISMWHDLKPHLTILYTFNKNKFCSSYINANLAYLK